MTVELEVEGIDQLKGVIESIIEESIASVRDYRWFELFGQYLVDLEDLHEMYFNAESDPVGQAWAPLSQVTISAKGHDEKLVDEERLLESVRMRNDDAIRYLQKDGEDLKLSFGTSVEYAHWHISGTRRMPARVFVGVSESVVDAWQDEISANAVAAITQGQVPR